MSARALHDLDDDAFDALDDFAPSAKTGMSGAISAA